MVDRQNETSKNTAQNGICEIAVKHARAFFIGERTAQQKEAIKKHLGKCESCRIIYVETRESFRHNTGAGAEKSDDAKPPEESNNPADGERINVDDIRTRTRTNHNSYTHSRTPNTAQRTHANPSTHQNQTDEMTKKIHTPAQADNRDGGDKKQAGPKSGKFRIPYGTIVACVLVVVLLILLWPAIKGFFSFINQNGGSDPGNNGGENPAGSLPENGGDNGTAGEDGDGGENGGETEPGDGENGEGNGETNGDDGLLENPPVIKDKDDSADDDDLIGHDDYMEQLKNYFIIQCEDNEFPEGVNSYVGAEKSAEQDVLSVIGSDFERYGELYSIPAAYLDDILAKILGTGVIYDVIQIDENADLICLSLY